MKNNTTTTMNPFAFAEDNSTETKTRRLDFTPALQETARHRATELVKLVSTERSDLADLANAMMDSGRPADLIDLITSVYDEEAIKSDSGVLAECPDDDLPKMLESQRSNRSKAKKAGLRTKLSNTVAYISAMYAEMLIRERTGKPYAGSGSSAEEYDLEALAADPDQLKKKINSLASKKSRLTKLAEYDEAAKTELAETEKALAELRGLRPATTRTVVKSLDVDQLRSALAQLDKDGLPADLLELMAKIG